MDFVPSIMYQPGSPFEVNYKGAILNAQEFTIADGNIFRILFPDQTPQLVITRAAGPDGKFWTSVPEGREHEAEGIGEQVLEFLKKK